MGLEEVYANSKMLHISPPTGYDTEETDIPVMVRIGRSAGLYRDDTSDIFDEIGASYQKMAISLDDDVTECPVEIKDWDTKRQLGILFVKIPSLPIDGMTLKLWYDSTAEDNANVGEVGSDAGKSVWSNNYAGVWHKPHGGLLLDSTANANHGTIYGATEVDGPLGRCLSFDGVDDSIVIPQTSSMQLTHTDPFTLTLGFNRAGQGGVCMICGVLGETGVLVFAEDINIAAFKSSSPDSVLGRLAPPVERGIDIIVDVVAVGTADLSDLLVYSDGVAQSTELRENTFSGGNLYSPGAPMRIGGYNTASFDLVAQIPGTIHFGALSSVARSPAWIALTNTSLKDNLIAFSEPNEESLSNNERMRLTPDGTLIAKELVEV